MSIFKPFIYYSVKSSLIIVPTGKEKKNSPSLEVTCPIHITCLLKQLILKRPKYSYHNNIRD